jgi:hypothetical protein
VYKELSDQLAVEKTKLDQSLKTDLPAMNKLLTDRKLKELTPTTTETPAPKTGE